MNISKRIWLLAAASVGLSPAYAQESSTEAQNKAIQVLRQKMAELNATTGEATARSQDPQGRSKAADALRRKEADMDRINAPSEPNRSRRQPRAGQVQFSPDGRRIESGETTAPPPADDAATSEVHRKAIEALRKAEADLRTEEERARTARGHPEPKTVTESEKKRDPLIATPPDERPSRAERRERRSRDRELVSPEPARVETTVDLTTDANREVHEKALDALHKKQAELDAEMQVRTPRAPDDIRRSRVDDKPYDVVPPDSRPSRRPPVARVITPPMLRGAPVLEPGFPPSQVRPREPREPVVIPPRTNGPPAALPRTPSVTPVPPERPVPAAPVIEPGTQARVRTPSRTIVSRSTGEGSAPPISPEPQVSAVRSTVVSAENPGVNHSEVHEKALQVLRQKQLDLGADKTPAISSSAESRTDANVTTTTTVLTSEANTPSARPWDARPREEFTPRAQERNRANSYGRRTRRGTADKDAEPVVNLAVRAPDQTETPPATFYDKAFEVLHNKYQELNAAPPAPAEVRTAVRSQPAGLSTDAEDKARRALRQKTAEMGSTKAVVAPRTGARQSATPPRDAVTNPGRDLPSTENSRALPVPLDPGEKTKQQKLADLLERYKADKVTPREYQQERRKILSEP